MTAAQQVDLSLNISTPGLNQANNQATILHNTLQAAADAASQIRTPTPLAAARQQSQQYNVARSAVGTGAEGRDFAKQSQGLGGLVRLYATFAANLFAASAAFGALSRAADTTNLIKGLDQLGAQSGRALGSLSKRLVDATDGAVSLREAMQATSQASAAGMSSEAILRMGQAASKASQALGLSMPDALSRISRGITKLEPELLDELGIFVRIDTASQDYARSLGKTTASLTEFERRQGFANAVLTQAEKKFGSIEINANPYAKLLASMQNLAQTGLELVNKVFTPIVGFLSSSPTALTAVMAGIAAILLKQAIPALGRFQTSLAQSTIATATAAQQRLLIQQTAEAALDTQAARSAENRYRLQNSYFNRIIALENSAGQIRNTTRVRWDELLTQNVTARTEEELRSATRRANRLRTVDPAESTRIRDRVAEIRELQRIEQEAADAGTAAAQRRQQASRAWYTQESALIRNSTRSGREATASHIYNMANQTRASLGASAALRELYQNISASRNRIDIPTGAIDAAGQAVMRLGPATTMAGRGIMYLSGTIRVAVASVGTVVASFMPWLEIIGLIITGVTFLVGLMGNTQKEAEETSKAITNLDAALAGALKTIETINKKPILEQISTESIQAKATALDELLTNVKAMVEKSNAELEKMNWASLGSNFVKRSWDGDVQSKLNEKISESLMASFQLLRKGPMAEEAKKSISGILGTSVTTSKELEEALKNMSDRGASAILKLLPELERLKIASSVSAAKGTELKDSFAQTNKVFEEFINSLRATDTFSKLGKGIIENAQKLGLALKDPTVTLNALLEVVRDVNNLRLFPEATGKNLISFTNQLKDLQIQEAYATEQLEQLDNQILALEKSKRTSFGFFKTLDETMRIVEEINKLEGRRTLELEVLTTVTEKTGELKKLLEKSVLDQFKQGAAIVSSRLAKDFAEATSTLKTGLAGMLGDTKAGIQLRAQYERENLNVQAEGIKVQLNLARVTELLAVEFEQYRIESAKEKIRARLPDPLQLSSDPQYKKLVEEENKLEIRKKDISSKKPESYTAVADKMGKGEIPLDQKRLNFLETLQGTQVGLTKINQQLQLSVIKEQADLVAKEYADAKKINDEKAKGLQNDKSRLDVLSQILGFDDESLVKQKQGVDNKIADLNIQNEILAKGSELALFAKLESEFRKKGLKDAADKTKIEVARITSEYADLTKRKGVEQNIKEQADRAALLKAQYDEEQRAQDKLYAKLEQSQKLEQERIQDAEGLLSIQQELSLITEQDYIKKKLATDLDKTRLDAQQKIDAARKTQAGVVGEAELKLAQLQGLPDSEEKTKAILRQKQIIEETNKLYDDQVSSLLKTLGINVDITKAKAGFATEVANRKVEQELLDRQYETLTLIKQIEQERLTYEEARLSNMRQLGILSDEDLVREKFKIDLARQTADAQNKLDELNKSRDAKLAEPQRIISTIEAINPEVRTVEQNTQLALQQALVADINSKYDIQYQSIFKLLGLNTDLLKSKAEQDALQARFNEKLKESESLTESLTSIFGDLGKSVGGFVTALIKSAKEQEEFALRKAQLEKDKLDPTKRADAEKALIKLDKDKAKSEIANIANIAGSTKKMFAEKTAAYKVLSGIEKAHSIMVMALQAKELATTIANTIQGITTKVPGIYASFMEMLGPFGPPAAAAAIAAFIGGAFGGGGGGKTVNMAGLTAEDRQKVQGTGQKWVNGSLVETGGGVFGDPTAKNESIVKSLEIMRANSIEGLRYDNKLLKAMEKVALAVTDAATSAYQVKGIRVGSAFDTVEGTTGGSSFFGLFGKKTTKTIQDSGIIISGTFAQLADATTSVVKQYETVLTTITKKSLLSSKTRSYVTTSEIPLEDPKLKKAFADVFQNATEVFKEIGSSAGIAKDTIVNTLSTLPISITTSLRGLTGPQVEAELNATIGAALAQASETLFAGMFEKFNKFGEDYLTTVIRVVDANDKLDQALRSIGSTFEIIPKYDISEALIKAAGGLEAFMSQANFFKENFLTAAEQLAPVQASVNKQLTKLGISTSITKDQYKQLVLAQDLGTESGRLLYQNLMDLAPGFMEVQKATENTKTAISNLVIDLLKAQGKTDEAKALTRARELASLSDSEKVLKQYIYTLEDEANLRAKIISARDKERAALTSTISSLDKYIDSLKNQKTALLGGASSILTPEEKYYQAKQRAQELAAQATAKATTEAEIQARNKALDELSAANTAFLEASRTLYASSDTYSADFASVLNTLDSTASILENQKTDAQVQIDLLNSSTAFLDAIAASTETTASLLEQYLSNQASYTEALNFDPSIITNPISTATTDFAIIMESATSVALATIEEANAVAAAESAAAASAAAAAAAAAQASIAAAKAIDSSYTSTWSGESSHGEAPGAPDKGGDTAGRGGGFGSPDAPGMYAASGGIITGLTLVGEQGPELVDFNTTGRVYTAQQTAGMFNASANQLQLIQEIQALRKEVAQLRAEQKEQTGYIISTNYDANNKNATTIVTANQTALSQESWKMRSAVVVA